GAEALDADHDRLPRLEALGHGRLLQCRRALVELAWRYPALDQAADLGQREHGALLLDHALDERVAIRGRGGHDQDEAARRVTHAVRRAQNAAARRDVDGARGGALAARAVRRPAGPLVGADLHAAC